MMTKLHAVNLMLGTIGLAPISSLEGDVTADVGLALNTLEEVSLQILEEGWHFNTEHDYPLVPDWQGEINLADTVLRVSLPTGYRPVEIIQRGNRLYNATLRSYSFDAEVRATVTLNLDWDETPQAFRQYVAVKAARRFAARAVGDEALHSFSERDEGEALAALRHADSTIGGWNMFSNFFSQRTLDRYRDPFNR